MKNKFNKRCDHYLILIVIILVISFASYAETAIYEFKKGDDIGTILDRVGACPLWGPKNNVDKFHQLNPNIDHLNTNNIKVGTKIIVPLPDNYTFFSNIYSIDQNKLIQMHSNEYVSQCKLKVKKIFPIVKKLYEEKIPEKIVTKKSNISRIPSIASMPRDYNFYFSPSYLGNKQSLASSGSNFDNAFYILKKIGGNIELHPSQQTRFSFSLFYQTNSLASATSSQFTIKESKASFFTPSFSVHHCAYEFKNRDQLCPYLKIGIDSSYYLQFVDNTTLSLATISDMYTSLGLEWAHLFEASSSSAHVNFQYDQGQKRGSNINVTWQKNSGWMANTYLQFPTESGNNKIMAGAQIINRDQQFLDKLDPWKLNSTMYELILGYKF